MSLERMSAGWAALRWALAVLWLASCAGDRVEPATQIIVLVSSELEGRVGLTRLRLVVEREDGIPTDQAELAVVASQPAEGQVVLPAAFTIIPPSVNAAQRFRLTVTGLGPTEDGREVELVSQTSLIAFRARKTLQVEFRLVPQCLMQACPGGTCYARAAGSVDRGQCGPIPVAEPVEIDPPAAREDVLGSPVPIDRESTDAGVMANLCSPNPCEHDGRCVPIGDRAVCSCVGTGFQGELCEQDVDECQTRNGGCSVLASCVNEPGTKRCECPETHSGDGVGEHGCVGKVTAITGGAFHACALMATGKVMCWGSNFYGELGDGTLTGSATPVAVKGLEGVVQVAAGTWFTCARLADDSVRCWGRNRGGELGDGTTTMQATPVPVAGLRAQQIATGDGHACAEVSGHVECWGSNDFGELGDGTTMSRGMPAPVSEPEDGSMLGFARLLSAGGQRSCAVSLDEVHCWGRVGASDFKLLPVSLPTFDASQFVTQIVSGEFHSCALSSPGRVSCWGSNPKGQLGDGTTVGRDAPIDVVDLGQDVAQIAAASHTCALMKDSTVRCWGGSNIYGELGDGTKNPSLVPVVVEGLRDVTQLALGLDTSCALLADGSLRCWGKPQGDMLPAPRFTPVAFEGF